MLHLPRQDVRVIKQIAAALTIAPLCLALALALPARAGEPTAPTIAATCGDLLERLGQKPPRLEFLRCSDGDVYGARALVAEYRVAGRDASEVEAHLVKVAAMPALHFICCGWDSVGNGSCDGVIKQAGASYQVSMTSGETLHNRREAWPEIAWFNVTITQYLEDP